MRYKLGLTLVVALGAAVFVARRGAMADDGNTAAQGAYVYVPPKPVRTYPATYPQVQTWIDNNDSVSIRAHGWDIWESITSRTLLGQPTWQTWYSGHELFEMASGQTRGKARGNRHGLIDFDPRPVHPAHRHTPPLRTTPDGIPFDQGERVFAFNRFSQSTARYIWRNQLYLWSTLQDTLTAMLMNDTPIALRSVLTSPDSTDAESFVLKPVFQFIEGDNVTAVPYWAGEDTSKTYDPGNPVPSRWRQAVAVDPTGRYQAGDSVLMVVNNEPPRYLRVVPLSAFYYVKITRSDSISFSQFGPINGDFIGLANDTSAQAVYMAMRPGNIALLMAMHVTGKEIPNWTWQSFWWAYNPQDPQFGADRPATIRAPWNRYNMTVAYSMTNPDGSGRIAFNPYLETSLAGKIPNGPGINVDSTAWTGVTSNCMSCHRRAAIGWTSATTPTFPPYGPAMFVADGDSVVFTQPGPTPAGRVALLKTDFLWSLAIRSHLPPVARRR